MKRAVSLDDYFIDVKLVSKQRGKTCVLLSCIVEILEHKFNCEHFKYLWEVFVSFYHYDQFCNGTYFRIPSYIL